MSTPTQPPARYPRWKAITAAMATPRTPSSDGQYRCSAIPPKLRLATPAIPIDTLSAVEVALQGVHRDASIGHEAGARRIVTVRAG